MLCAAAEGRFCYTCHYEEGGGVLCRGNFGRLFFILCQSPDLGGFDLCRGNGEHYRTSMGATVEGIYFSD
jgi:hypothetical protein